MELKAWIKEHKIVAQPSNKMSKKDGTYYDLVHFDYWIHFTLDFIAAILGDLAHQKPTQSDVDCIVSYPVIPWVLLSL